MSGVTDDFESTTQWPYTGPRDRWDGEYSPPTTSDFWHWSRVPPLHAEKFRLRGNGKWRAELLSLEREAIGGQGVIACLLGGRGGGKTQLATCLIARLCFRGRRCRYTKAMDMFRKIRDCYRSGRDRKSDVKIVNALCGVDVLVIDELQERADSEWEQRTLTNIVDRRYDNRKVTILISNLLPEAFAAAIGPSIVSRISEVGRVVECTWPSFRNRPAENGPAVSCTRHGMQEA
jgi:DNA replication protein DnaC